MTELPCDARIDSFIRGMGLILPFAAMPIVELVGITHAPATSAEDLERVGDFLITLADAVKSRAPLEEAA
jgi:hypothetical protein